MLSTPTLKSQVKFYRRFLLPTHTGTWPLKTAFGASRNKGLPRRLLKLSPWRNTAQEDLHDLGGVLHKEPEGDNCSFWDAGEGHHPSDSPSTLEARPARWWWDTAGSRAAHRCCRSQVLLESIGGSYTWFLPSCLIFLLKMPNLLPGPLF